MAKEMAIRQPETVDFRLLGPLQAYSGTSLLALGAPQQQRLLVGLLSVPGSPVSFDKLQWWVWGETPAAGAVATLYQLKCRLVHCLDAAGLGEALIGTNGAYQFKINPERVDVHRFNRLVKTADRVAFDDERTASSLEEALLLVHGEPLTGLSGQSIDSYRVTLNETILKAKFAFYELVIRLGQRRDLVPELTDLVQKHPGNERASWLLMHALYRAGRPEDAQLAFHHLRTHLNQTIATSSLVALSDLYQRMLARDPALLTPSAVAFLGEHRPLVSVTRVDGPNRKESDVMNDEPATVDQNDDDQAEDSVTFQSEEKAENDSGDKGSQTTQVVNHIDTLNAPWGFIGNAF